MVRERYGRVIGLEWYTKRRKEMWGWEAEYVERDGDRFWKWMKKS
jgi:hypothetical protein